MTTPAGWYDDGSGRQRWWDGQQWTEHFAPEVPSVPEVPAVSEVPAGAEVPAADEAPTVAEPAVSETPTVSETPAAEQVPAVEDAPLSDVDSPAETPSTPDHAAGVSAPDAVEDAVVAPEAPQDWASPAAATPTTPFGGAAYPGSAVPPVPPVPQGGAGAYPGATAPAYPAAPGAYPATDGAYPAAGTYAVGGYPAAAPYAAAPTGPKKMSVLGLVGLGLAALGLILAFIPFTLPFAWVLLAAGFIVSIISLFLKGKKWPGFTGLGVSILGAIVAFVMGFVFLFALANEIQDAIPDPIPTSDTGTDDGNEESAPPADVAEGGMGEPVTVQQVSGTGEVTVNSATWSPTNGSGFDPTNGGYLLIDLTWKSLDGTTYVNPLYLSIETAEGAAGDYDFFSDATLQSSELPAGETTQGTVSFDVAQSGSYVIIITDELLQEVARVTVEPSAG